MFRGEIIPNDGFVDLDDLLRIGSGASPSNSNSNGALLCVTDLVDCCAAPHTVRGNWFFPDNRIVGESGFGFLANRGPNEVINGQQFNGSVRLFLRFIGAPERGRFRCELPSDADPSVNQILYVNICEFITSCRTSGLVRTKSDVLNKLSLLPQ